MDLLPELLKETAAQGFGYVLAVISWVVMGFLFWLFRKREDELVDKLNAEKDAHLADIKQASKEKEQALLQMNDAQVAAIKEATGAMQGLEKIAASTKQTVEFILNGGRG